jgi:hypothetical protein
MSQLPKPLLTAIREHRCVVFVGAGASMDAIDGNGNPLPHWGALLIELLTLIQESPEPDTNEVVTEIQGMIDHGDYMAISEWIDYRLGDASFRQHLLNRLATAKSSRVHEILSSKPFRAVLTTNYDRLTEIHWERQGKNPFVVIPQNADNIAIATTALQSTQGITPIIRAHGALNDPRTLIFFPRSYREIMFRNEPFRQFMSMIFRQFTVLFVGTSFRDPNFQSLLQWVYTVTDGKEAGHYAILDGKGPVFKRYMKVNYNIEFITYQAPAGDHSELLRLLDSI